MKIENDIENRLIRKVNALHGLTFKFTSPSTKGVPDRVVIYRGRTIFIELKRPGQQPTSLQKYWLRQINNQNVKAISLSTFGEVDTFIEELKRSNTLHGSHSS